MKLKSLILSSLAFCGLVVSSAQAQSNFSYTFLDASYKWTNFDESMIDDGNGLESNISFSPIENFFVEGGYEYLNTEIKGIHGLNVDTFRYGAGGYYPVTADMDIVGRVGGLHSDARAGSAGNQSDDGLYVGTALRIAATKELEIEPSVEYSHYPANDADWTYGVKGLYDLTREISAIADITLNDESDLTLSVGARYSFKCN